MMCTHSTHLSFSLHDSPPTQINTLSLTTLFRSPSTRHRAPSTPFRGRCSPGSSSARAGRTSRCGDRRSEEHTSELQSRFDLVCRLLLEKKKDRDTCNLTIKTCSVLSIRIFLQVA